MYFVCQRVEKETLLIALMGSALSLLSNCCTQVEQRVEDTEHVLSLTDVPWDKGSRMPE